MGCASRRVITSGATTSTTFVASVVVFVHLAPHSIFAGRELLLQNEYLAAANRILKTHSPRNLCWRKLASVWGAKGSPERSPCLFHSVIV
jgi:hypothetical protein